MGKERIYFITVPFGEEDLVEIGKLLSIVIAPGSFDIEEKDFQKSGETNRWVTLLALPELTLRLYFEKYEGYLNVEIKGFGISYNNVSQYLYDRYIKAGANEFAQKKPDLFL